MRAFIRARARAVLGAFHEGAGAGIHEGVHEGGVDPAGDPMGAHARTTRMDKELRIEKYTAIQAYSFV